jgi:hypothetical protein
MASHPYTQYEKLPLWKVIDAEIAALIKNKDLAEMTARPYIVGSLCKALDKAGLLSEHSAKK